jgi:hypothetical protein
VIDIFNHFAQHSISSKSEDSIAFHRRNAIERFSDEKRRKYMDARRPKASSS